MTGTRLQRARTIFERLADLPSDQRGPILAEECGGDEQLQAFVEELLANLDGGMGGFLANPAYVPAPDEASADATPLPRRFGRYEIVRVLGEGGMGTVYEAQQENPRRRVALKVIRPGLVAGQMLRRFQYEADVLGRLRHPGIAQIYEADTAEIGTAEGGTVRQPYFAMEFIQGEPLTDHARHHKLGTRACLKLVAMVCDAVEHAHQKGVIHRDLKPGNVLVDESGEPKILDFGVARATDADVHTLTTHTGVGQLIGTVPYMSPEQVSGDSRQLDTRSDVYALGVILYELLSESVPHDVRDLPLPEAARKIRDEEPRHLGSIDRTLRGEVETLVARAMEKDKTRRYQSASELAADIRRYLRDEPIEAKRDSALYVLRKTVARYRGLVASGGLLLLLLVVFSLVSFSQAQKNRRLAAREREARTRADTAAKQLTAELTASNIERGRLFTRAGHLLGAEDLIWREHLTNPRSIHPYWALRELYSQHPSLATFVGHDGELRGFDFSTDGRFFASCSIDHTVRIWDAETYQPVAALEGHSDEVYSVSYSPDGRWIASGSSDGTVMVWNADTHDRVHTLRGHRGTVYTVVFAADAGHLISGGEDATVRVWDATTGECVRVIEEHRSAVVAARYNRNVQVLATASIDGTIELWRDLSGPSIATLTNDEGASGALALSPDGQKVALGGRDTRLIYLWNLTGPPHRETLGKATNGTVRFLAFTSDGETLISCGWYRIERWNLATRQRQPPIGHEAYGGAISPDGRVLVVGWGPGAIRVTDILAQAGVIHLGGQSNVGVASISPDGRIIACGDDTNHIRLWETATGRLLARLPSATWRWSSAHFHPSGKMLATCGADGVVRVWDLDTGTPMYSFEGVHVTTGQSLSFSPDGQIMAVTRPDQTVQVRDVGTGDVLATLPSLGSEALAARISPDGRIIATTHRGDKVALWTETGERLGTLACGIPPWTVDFRPDGQKLAVGAWSHHIQIWDLEARKLEARLGESKSVVWGVAYRPSDTNILATCSGDGGVKLWDLSERRNVLTLEPFGGADALSVSFTPDGKTLVAAGFDGSLCVWDLEYYDRHIAGNLEYQIDRLRDDLGDSIQTERLRAWAKDVLRRPWPRIGPHARIDADLPGSAAPQGIDPDVIATWGRVTPSSANP